MSDTVMLLFLVGLAGFLLGVLLLYAAAFRSGWLWGIVCLLLPPLLLLYIPLRWRHAQYGVYVLLVGLLTSGAGLYAGADGAVQAWLQRPQVQSYIARLGWHGEIRLPFKSYQPAQLPNAAAAAAIRAQEKAKKPSPPPATTVLPAPVALPNVFQAVSLNDLGHYVGSVVRITNRDGGQVSGQLVRANSLGVTVAAQQDSGSVSYHVAWTRLRGAEVYAPRGSIPAPRPATAATLASPASVNPPPSVTVAPSTQIVPLPASTSPAPAMPVSPPAAAAQAPSGAVNATSSGTP